MITKNVDCADKGNVVQAKHELHRAVEVRDSAARTILLGDWSVKWGDALIEVAENYECYDDVQDELSDAEKEIESLRDELNASEEENDELEEYIQKLEAKVREFESA